MSSGYVLAIDQGTSGTKAVVVDVDLRVLACVEEPVTPSTTDGGEAEHDPRALLDSVLSTGRRALAEAGVSVAAVALANQGESVLAWDPASGTPYTPVLVWHDRRAHAVVEALSGHRDELEAITGLPLDPYFGAPKMTWIREHLTRDGVVSSSDAWLVHQLCGAFVTDSSTASRMMLTDIRVGDWSDRALEIFGLRRDELPRIVDNLTVVGTTDLFGQKNLPVVGLVVDQQAALLAQHCLSPGESKCTYGTGAFLLAHTGRDVVTTSGLIPSVAWNTGSGDEFCLDGQVLTAGSALGWLVDVGLLPAATSLDDVASSVADSAGVTFVPSFAGLAAPQWRPDARAAIGGLGLGHTSGHVARAFAEGLASLVAELARRSAAASGSPLSVLRADGGLTRSRVLMQTQADLLQAPVEVHSSPHATALGAAALAQAWAQGTTDLARVVPLAAPSAVYEPLMPSDRAEEILARVAAAIGDPR